MAANNDVIVWEKMRRTKIKFGKPRHNVTHQGEKGCEKCYSYFADS